MLSSDESAARDGLDALRFMFEEAYPKLLAFVRCRSAPALAARRDPEDILQT